MSIEKMKLISFTGKTGRLDKIISKCLLKGDFHVEPAGEYIGFSEIIDLVSNSGDNLNVEEILSYGTTDGKFNPTQAVQYISAVLGYDTSSGDNPYVSVLQSLKELAAEFGFTLDEGKKQKKKKSADFELDEDLNEYIVSVTQKLKALDEERKQIQQQIKKCEEGISQFSHFSGLDIPLEEINNCEFITARFGHMPKENVEKLNVAYGDNPYVLFIPCTTEGKDCWGAYVLPKENTEEIDKIFSAFHFERLWIPEAVGSTDKIISNLRENIEILNSSARECDYEIKKIFETEQDHLKSIYVQICAKNAVFEVKKNAFILGNGFYCVGWVSAKKVDSLISKLKSFKSVEVNVMSPEDVPEHEPPVKLKNFKFTRPYEYYVGMYGLPGYHDIDITFFVAIVYTFVFGVMFGDVGQGLLLAVGGFLASKFMKLDLGKILVPCGISSMICGFVFGSVFGFEEALDPLYHKLGMASKPVEVMDSVNGILVFSVFVGVFLVFAAMLLHIVISVKQKKYGEALFSQNGVAGIVLYSAGVSAVYSFMGGPEIIPKKAVVVMFIVSLVLLFNKEILICLVERSPNIKPESMADFIMQNVFECLLYVLEYFSNTLSFLRVGAFVIVHASMMKVVFTLAGDTSSVKGIIVVVIGNIVVIALEGLLTGIQGLRLVFYEMFSRFHEGGGKPFNPVKLKKDN